MCYKIPVLKTEEEFWEWDGRGEASTDSVNAVKDVPENFKQWVKKNSGRIKNAQERGTLPYFIKDNRDKVDGILRIESNRMEYESYDGNWKRIKFNAENGGYIVHHTKHQFAGQKIAGAKYSGGEAEKIVGEILCDKHGKCIEFLQENGKNERKPDLRFDGESWDVKYVPIANENTIRKQIKDAKKAQNVIFFWDDEDRLPVLYNAAIRESGSQRRHGKNSDLPNIYYISKEGVLEKLNIKKGG